ALFTDEHTPGCTASSTGMCSTNTVTLTVSIPPTAPSGGTTPAPAPTTPISNATAVHTGEPWAGSAAYAAELLALGLGLALIGELGRRRRRRRLADTTED
ncbi:MAG TPA: hypothetical protein VEI83_15995, partial [Acidimicrobiales bacterium]|nr:hypothetical protein [Acidimicrobiales bacterium]